jgi:hypothetical protein
MNSRLATAEGGLRLIIIPTAGAIVVHQWVELKVIPSLERLREARPPTEIGLTDTHDQTE